MNLGDKVKFQDDFSRYLKGKVWTVDDVEPGRGYVGITRLNGGKTERRWAWPTDLVPAE